MVSPQRGVRQGCPVSPYLFIMAVELLAISVRENQNIKGIKIFDTEIKISQLADDTTCFVEDLLSVQEILYTFKAFSKCAGLKVNIEKTKAKFIGKLKYCTETPLNLDWSDDNISTLGLCISGDENENYELNFRKRILNLENLLRSWKCRNLSLKGKITIINNIAISPLLYAASVLHVPERVYFEVKRLITNFIWGRKHQRLHTTYSYRILTKGG